MTTTKGTLITSLIVKIIVWQKLAFWKCAIMRCCPDMPESAYYFGVLAPELLGIASNDRVFCCH